MSTTGEAIFAILSADAALNALVGTRIYPVKAPQGAIASAFVVYTVISSNTENLLASDPNHARISNVRLQVDSYAKSYLDSQAVAAAVDAAIGDLSAPSPGISSWSLSSRDLYDDQAELYRVSADFDLWR